MSFRILQAAFCFIMIGVLVVEANAQDRLESEQVWRQRALQHINEIQNPKVLGRALYNFTPVRLAAGDIDGASADAVRISNLQLRIYAHYKIASYRKALGDTDGAVAEVNAAYKPATEWRRGFCSQHLDACLDIANSLPMAQNYVSNVVESNPSLSLHANSSLARALAKRGYFKEAMQIVNRSPKAERLLSEVALATAKRGEVVNTEEILQRISNDTTKDNVYLALIRALGQREFSQSEFSQREFKDDALKLVSKIKDPVERSKTRLLQRSEWQIVNRTPEATRLLSEVAFATATSRNKSPKKNH